MKTALAIITGIIATIALLNIVLNQQLANL